MDIIESKKGSAGIITLTLMSMIFIILLFGIVIKYVEIISIILTLKNDLYYIAQNGIIANGKDNFSLDVYHVDDKNIKEYIQKILDKNYLKNERGVRNVVIKECRLVSNENDIKLHTKNRYKEPIIHLTIDIYFKSIINLNKNDISKKTIHEDIKVSLLQYK